MTGQVLEFKYLNNNEECVGLSDNDRKNVERLYQKITSQINGPAMIKVNDIFQRIESKYDSKYSRVFRDEDGEVVGFVDAVVVSKNEKHMMVNFLSIESGKVLNADLIETFNNFKKSAKKEGCKFIVFNGLNEVLNKFMVFVGFKDVGDGLYILNL